MQEKDTENKERREIGEMWKTQESDRETNKTRKKKQSHIEWRIDTICISTQMDVSMVRKGREWRKKYMNKHIIIIKLCNEYIKKL